LDTRPEVRGKSLARYDPHPPCARARGEFTYTLLSSFYRANFFTKIRYANGHGPVKVQDKPQPTKPVLR
jgi:hypothetical protein